MKLTPLIQNKKADVFQIFVVLIITVAVAITGLLMLVMTNQINDFWANSPFVTVNSTAYNANVILQETAPKTTDYAIFFVFLGLNLGCVIAAVKTNFSPILIFFFILLTFISIMMAAGMVNLYQGFAHAAGVIETASELTLTNFVFSKYTPLFVTMISALILIIMYGKSSSEII